MELMRGLAFVALLFAGSAVGAELRQAEVCGDGTTHQAGFCPAVLSSASCSATGATTGSCSATSDESDGTRYVCATSSVTALTGAQIEACSGGAAIAGSSAAETGSNSVSLSGLTTDAAHYGQIVNESPEGWYSNRLVSGSFTPATSGNYDISALPARFQSIEFATLPTTSSSSNVSSQAALNSAIGSATLINVAAGSYSSISIGGGISDLNIVLDDAAVFSGGISIDPQSNPSTRIRISGGVFGGQINIRNQASHVTLDNVRNTTGGLLLDVFGQATKPHHVTVLNSTLRATASGTYGIAATGVSNFIVANTDVAFTGSAFQAGVRLGQMTNFIFIDGRIANSGTNRILRIHADDGASDLGIVYNSQLEHSSNQGIWFGPTTSTGTNSISRLEFRNNTVYYPDTTAFNAVFQIDGDQGGGVDDVIIQDNTFNVPASDQSIGGSSVTNFTNTPNTFNSYSTPPAFTGGADH